MVVEMKRAFVVEQKEEKMACFYEMCRTLKYV